MFMLVLVCAVLRMLAVAQAEAQYFIIAPNVIRMDVEETILVHVFGISDGSEVPVTLYFQLTGSNQRISEQTVRVTKDVPQEAILQISRDQLAQQDTSKQQFITLVATANTPQLQINDRRTILLGYQSGFVFIQTDKPLYTPTQTVDIRVAALDQKMHPVYHNLKVDIVNPDGIIVHRYEKAPEKGFLTLQFYFPPLPVFGNWTIIAHYGHKFKANSSVQFEVKEYVLPKFDVEVRTQEKYIVPETINLITIVTARYAFGESVFGNYLIKYGVYTDDGNLTILQIKQGQLNDDSPTHETLHMPDVRMENWAERLMGKRLIIQAFVTDIATGETINANNTQVVFSRTPYKFNWDLTQQYFKKGLPFAVKANVQFISGLPAAGIDVVVTAEAELENGNEVPLEGSRVNNAQEALTKLSGSQGEVDFRLDVPSDANLINITLVTTDPDLTDSAQSRSSFIVQPQESGSSEYLLLYRRSSAGNRRTQIGRNSFIQVQLTHPENVATLHFFVIAGGKIVHKGSRQQISHTMDLRIAVTQDMEPSARVVAYYTSTTGYVIADSLFFEVKEQCEYPILLEFEGLPKVTRDEATVFETDRSDKNVVLRISAAEYTNIGVLAVDEAIFTLRNYHRLTQKKIFERMAGYDLGCGPGGGPTTATIFKDAGVTLMTNANVEVPQREALGCSTDTGRSRRSVSQTDRDKILNRYHGPERRYCEKGLRKLRNPASMTCAERARHFARRNRLDEESFEIRVFYDCCKALAEAELGRSGDVGDSGSVNFENVEVRSNFPESWLFYQVDTEDQVTVRRPATLPGSVTTWVVEAVGVSEDYKICVADPIKLEVQPPFFLDVSMPYSVQRLEQIEILVSVFNYADVTLPVSVYLKGVEGLCSVAQPDSYSPPVTIDALPKKPTSVKFVVVPLEAKSLPIEIVAVTNASTINYQDGVRKDLNVRPEGYKQRDTVTIIMDPENIRGSLRNTIAGGKNQSYQHTQFWGAASESKQVDIIRYELNNQAIPGTHQIHFSLMGNMMGSVVETVLGSLDDLLRIPRGCGEQTMLYLAPNVYIYRYLKYTDHFTAAHETSSRQYIGDGIANELSHRRSDGSFSVWGDNPSYPSSTWLTAFVSKVMCQAKEFAYVDDVITCQAMEWLITQTQEDDGSFKELYRVHHQEMTGGVQGKASLTAYVLIALLECDCKTISKNATVTAATSFLELELPALTRPYAIAITLYALALAKSSKVDQAAIDRLKDISHFDEGSNSRHWGSDDSSFGAGPKPYWYSNRPKAIEVETTSYALLALLKVEDVQYTHAIVNWLTNQENYEGGFVSTQDTVIALQALSEYAIQTDQTTIDIDCHVTCTETNFEERFSLRPHNAIVRQHSPIHIEESVPQFIVSFASQGVGMGQVKFESSYHIPEPDYKKCDFDLIINGQEGKSGDGGSNGDGDNLQVDEDSRSRVGRIHRRSIERGSGLEDTDVDGTSTAPVRGRAGGMASEHHFNYDIKVRYLRGEETGMAIVDVGLYTGYKPRTRELEDVKEQSGGVIQRYEVTDRSVVFYLTKITEEYTVINFNAQRVITVGKFQPVAIHVYDYYNPTVECVKFIHPEPHSDMLSTLCEGDTCICAAGICADNPSTKQAAFVVNKLKEKACASAAHFAYEVQVTSFKRKPGFQTIKMTILNPIKRGLDAVTEGDTRTFWKSSNCGKPEIKKKRYLVIGSGGLPTKDDNGRPSYKYIVDEKMSFYEWPTASKVRSVKKWKRISDNLKAFKDDFGETGTRCIT